MRTLTVLSVFLLGFGAVLVFHSQQVLAQRGGRPTGGGGGEWNYQTQPGGMGTPVRPVPMQPGMGGGMQQGGQQPPWMQQQGGAPGGQQRGGQRGGMQGALPGGQQVPGGRGGAQAQPGAAQRNQPTGGMGANQTTQMVSRLRAMDANGNGILEPNEIPDNRRTFVESIVTQMGGNANAPIDLARLERRAVNNAATQSNTPRQSDTAGRQARQQTPTLEPLIRPFGESQPAAPPLLGFGQKSAAAQETAAAEGGRNRRASSGTAIVQPQMTSGINTVKQSEVYDSIREEVRTNPRFSWFFEYDTDRDAQLSMSEYNRGRGGVWTVAIADEFTELDRNGDGFVTVDEALTTIKEWEELAARTAREQQEQAPVSASNFRPGQPQQGRPTGAPNVRMPGSGNPGFASPASGRDNRQRGGGRSGMGTTFQDGRRGGGGG